MPFIAPETFTADETQEECKYFESGTVEVALFGKTRRLPASRARNNGSITAYGLGLRFPTGTKIWHGHALRYADGREIIGGGFDRRSGRHARPQVVGFYDDVAEKHRSAR